MPANAILLKKGIDHPAKDKLPSYMRASWKKTIDIPEPEFSEYVNSQFKTETAEHKNDLEEVMKSHIHIADIKLSALENAYGNLDFIFGNRKFRFQIYRELHQPLQNDTIYISGKAFHFRTYFAAQNANIADMLDLVNELQNKHFTADVTENEYSRTTTVYRTFIDASFEKAEQLRCTIYRQNDDSRKSTPFLSYTEKLKYHSPNPFIDKKSVPK